MKQFFKRNIINVVKVCDGVKIVIASIGILISTSVFAQGYALDEVYKESNSHDSDFNPFYAFVGILMIFGVCYILKALFSSFSNSDKNKTYSTKPKEIKPLSREDEFKKAMEAVAQKQKEKELKAEILAKWTDIQNEALQILKTEYQKPYEFDNHIFIFKPDELTKNTIDAFTMGYYWGVTRQMTHASMEQIKKVVRHHVVRLGYERGLKAPQKSIGHCSEFMPMEAPMIFPNSRF